jgi:hypothetical protein
MCCSLGGTCNGLPTITTNKVLFIMRYCKSSLMWHTLLPMIDIKIHFTAETNQPTNFRAYTVFTVFRLLTDFVCLYNYEFWLSLCKIVRSSVILLLPLYSHWPRHFFYWNNCNKSEEWAIMLVLEVSFSFASVSTIYWSDIVTVLTLIR